MTLRMTPPLRFHDPCAGVFSGQKAGQPAIGAEARRTGIAGTRPTLVAIAVAHHARAVPEREAVGQEPHEAGQADELHARRLQLPGQGGLEGGPAGEVAPLEERTLFEILGRVIGCG